VRRVKFFGALVGFGLDSLIIHSINLFEN